MNEQQRNKIYRLESTPPPGVWDRIAAELDQSDIGSPYSIRLRDAAVAAPPGTWKKIEAGLQPTLPRLSRHRGIPWMKYAAAAVIIVALAWGGAVLLNRDQTQGEIVKTPGPVEMDRQPVPGVIPPQEPVATAEPTPSEVEARNDEALEASKKTYARLNSPRRNKIRNAAGFHFALENPDPILVQEDTDPATRYIVLMTPDGNFIRMSKKWSELVCCVAGEEQDPGCIDQLKKWREKLGHSSQTASPGNFGDILQLVRSLQQD